MPTLFGLSTGPFLQPPSYGALLCHDMMTETEFSLTL